MNISKEQKRAVYDAIMSQDNPLGRYSGGTSYEDLNVVDFLKLIWDLLAMPSEDGRFRNAEADATQHMVNNDDWTLEDALLKRFNLLAGEQKYFVKFVEAVVSPEVRESKEEIESFVSIINTKLKDANFELAVMDYMNDLPVYRLMEGKNNQSINVGELSNSHPIFVDTLPNVFPSFLLQQYTWDDYGFKTRYKLYYYESRDEYRNVGVVRIMKRDKHVTYQTLPSSLMSFDNEYCSLGQDLSYYKAIKTVLGLNYRGFLYAMRDAAVFSTICDEFCETIGFKQSLLRERRAEEALQNAVYILAGYPIDEPYSFLFKAKMPYSPDDFLNIKFDLGRINDDGNLNRVMAVIGNNGVGKTTLLSQLAECIVKGEDERFEPTKPIFKKVISASYSIFDNFYKIEGSSFNYTYCGIQRKGGELMSSDEIESRRMKSIKEIGYHDRHGQLHNYLNMLMPVELVDSLLDGLNRFDEARYLKVHKKLSSGQSMLMNLVIEILAHIRHNTLILLDEPEVHLHPKGITRIINILNEICRDFSSCCILATHSSVIVQELLSRNVIVMDKEPDGTPVVRPMRVESLGENLTTITEDVFGRSEAAPYYKKMVERLVRENVDIEHVLQVIQNNDVPISMPLYMLIDKYFSQK